MGEIKAGFQIGQKFQKHVAQLVQSDLPGRRPIERSPPATRRGSAASITPSTASAWVRSMRPLKKALSVNSPRSANRAPAVHSDVSKASKIGGEPIVWNSATVWPV